jgi:hypothetical protein
MEQIGIEPTWQNHPARKWADFHLVFHDEKMWPTEKGSKADGGKHTCAGRHGCWCSFPRRNGLGFHSLERGPSKRASAPDAYRRAPVTGHQFQRDQRSYPLWEWGLLSALPQRRKTASGPEHGKRQGKRRLQQAGGFLRAILTW